MYVYMVKKALLLLLPNLFHLVLKPIGPSLSTGKRWMIVSISLKDLITWADHPDDDGNSGQGAVTAEFGIGLSVK